jgi:5-methylthioadenosine/S-adenosylhomocysteine deaminase
MSNILLRNVVLNGSTVNVRIEGNRFQSISQTISVTPADETIDAHGQMAILPAFYNAHTHAAMSLLRGFADDLDLFDWLGNHIWPVEARLTNEDVYAGTRLAILEMIKSGTVFFNDMYWRGRQAVRAAEEMGVRACVGILRQTMGNPAFLPMLDNDWLLENRDKVSSRIQISVAPHAIYTTTEEILRDVAETAKKHGLVIHTHLAETKKEFDDCMAQHGTTPAAYVDRCGILTDKTILAHSVALTDEDIELLAERRSVLVHMPVSNMKLVSGHFRYDSAALFGKCRWAIGTDGASSNNSLSMLGEMKTAALRGKDITGDPKTMKAADVFRAATQSGAEAFGIDAGAIEEGRLADCILVNLNNHNLVPGFNLVSDMVYAADSSCIDTVICDGRVLMRGGRVDGEEEIVSEAREAAKRLTTK